MTTEQILIDYLTAVQQAASAAIEALKQPGPEPLPPPPPPGEFSRADLDAVANLRRLERVQLVPRGGRGGGFWRVDWREPNNKPHFGVVSVTIAEAYESSSADPTFPKGDESEPLTMNEVAALGRLKDLGDRGSCSVRWEGARASFADHNWGNPQGSHTKFPAQGLIEEPVAHLVRAHG